MCHVIHLTPTGRAAIATLLVEGANATKIVDRLFCSAAGKSLDKFPTNCIVYGHWAVPQMGGGEDLVVCRRSDTRVEIHCHGGQAAETLINQSLLDMGCRRRAWRDWAGQSESAWSRAAARIALADARTERTAKILLDQYAGAFESEIDAIIGLLERPQVDAAKNRLKQLGAFTDLGLHLVQPWRVVVGGRPNVGKSSLINALLGYQRSIVFDEPGTTRDVITAETAFDGWPVQLVDTAGLRESCDGLENVGVNLAQRELRLADRVILVFDASESWSHEDVWLVEQWSRAIRVHNKVDCLPLCLEGRPPGIHASAMRGDGLEVLIERLTQDLVPSPPPSGAAVPFTPEQGEAVREAYRTVAAGHAGRASAILTRLLRH